MKVFLSYALPDYNSLLPARLRANALAYQVELLLPNTNERHRLTSETGKKIRDSQTVIAFVTDHAPQIAAVNVELKEAARQNKPVIALVENFNLMRNVPSDRIVLINQSNPAQYEAGLSEAPHAVAVGQPTNKLETALAGIGLVALGLYAFGELTKE